MGWYAESGLVGAWLSPAPRVEAKTQAASASPGAVVHVGCDPATFARDLATWREQGYAVRRLAVINAFPGTHHMEALALLESAELY